MVHCTCSHTEGDGMMVQCESCLTWQHGACLGIDSADQVLGLNSFIIMVINFTSSRFRTSTCALSAWPRPWADTPHFTIWTWTGSGRGG